MKKQIIALFFFLVCGTSALAGDWTQGFSDTYFAKGIDEAVIYALGEGAPPDLIIKTALPIKELKQEELIKALYCALVPPAYIQDASTANGVTEATVQMGYELALAQCAEEMEEKAKAAPAFHPGKSVPGGRSATASPSNFN